MKRVFAPVVLLLAVLIFFGCSEQTRTLTDQERVSNLQAQLDALKAKIKAKKPPEVVSMLEFGVQTLVESHIVDYVPKVGDPYIDFALPGPFGEKVKISEKLKKGPVVLVWYRGGWCPFCNLQLHAYQDFLPDFKRYGAELVAVSPEKPGYALSTKEKIGLDFDVLSDVGNVIAKEYGLVYTIPSKVARLMEKTFHLSYYNGDDSNELPLAVTFIIDTDGIIKYAFVTPDFRKRAEPSEVVSVLRELNRS